MASVFILQYFRRLVSNKRTDIQANVVWPERNGQQALPKSQMQKANREQPSRKPGKSSEAMIFDFNFVHNTIKN